MWIVEKHSAPHRIPSATANAKLSFREPNGKDGTEFLIWSSNTLPNTTGTSLLPSLPRKSIKGTSAYTSTPVKMQKQIEAPLPLAHETVNREAGTQTHPYLRQSEVHTPHIHSPLLTIENMFQDAANTESQRWHILCPLYTSFPIPISTCPAWWPWLSLFPM